MKSQRKKLTKPFIASLPYVTGDARPYMVRDVEQRSFFLMVGVRSKVFYVQRDVRDEDGARRTVRQSLGRFEDGLSAEEARRAAASTLVDIKQAAATIAADPTGQASDDLTLAEAWALFESGNGKGNKPRADKTVARYRQFVRAGYLASWWNKPLRTITRKLARERHRSLADEIAAGKFAGAKSGRSVPQRQTGKQSADDVFRWFRAIWNRAMREDETLPTCPTINVDWFNVKAERTALPANQLAPWHAGVTDAKVVANPIRRDFLLFVLFTGMRREAASVVRWSDIDLTAKTLLVRKPKGGEDRAFTLPLPAFVVALLKARRKENPKLAAQGLVPEEGLEYVFPAFGRDGHIAEPREEIPGVKFTTHDLRRTFATVDESLDIAPYALGALLNHAQPGATQTAKYVRHDVERLRAPMEKVALELERLCGANKDLRLK